jgi:RNA polymerase sigma-70 factor, ECF subfamily
MPGGETAVPSMPSDTATFDEEPGAAKAVLHRDIEANLPNLRRYARSLTRDPVAADDLVQECLARALAKLHLWRGGTDMRAWLFTIMYNHYVSQRRRATCESTTIEWSDCAQALTCAPQQIERLELRDLERAIMSLPKEQRTAVLLVGLTPASYREIASAYDVPVGTIRSRLSRGRETLRKLMGIAPSQHPRASRPLRAAASDSASTLLRSTASVCGQCGRPAMTPVAATRKARPAVGIALSGFDEPARIHATFLSFDDIVLDVPTSPFLWFPI